MNRPSHRSCTLHRSAYRRSWRPSRFSPADVFRFRFLETQTHRAKIGNCFPRAAMLKAFFQTQLDQLFPGGNTFFTPSPGGVVLVQHDSQEWKVSFRTSLCEFVGQDAGRQHIVFSADPPSDTEHPFQIENAFTGGQEFIFVHIPSYGVAEELGVMGRLNPLMETDKE